MLIKDKKDLWKEEIISKLEKENILWFIVEEVKDSLDYLNPYKMKNVYENLDQLIFALKQIEQSYIEGLKF